MASRTALLLLLGAICVGLATAEIAVDCCLTIVDKQLPLKLLQSYIILEAGKGCEISATAFITHAGRKLCVSHPKDRAWVRGHIKYLDERNNKQS